MKFFTKLTWSLFFFFQTVFIQAQGFDDDVDDVAPSVSIDKWIFLAIFVAVGITYYLFTIVPKNIQKKYKS